jgi:ATP-binding cassette, subfamily B, multidrug efflux pump
MKTMNPFVRRMPLIGLIFQCLKSYWHYYLFALLSLIGTHTIQSELPFLAKDLADNLSSGKSIFLGTFFILAIGIIFFRTASRILIFFPARFVEKTFRVGLLERIEETIPARYHNYSSGDIFQVLYGDLEQIRALMGFAFLQIGNIIVAIFVLAPRLASFHSSLIWALSPMVLSSLLFSLIVYSTRSYYRKGQDSQAKVQNFIMESYLGKKTIQNHRAENVFVDLFKKNSYTELLNFFKGGIGISFSVPLVPLGVGLSLLWGAYLVKAHDLGANALIVHSGFVFLFLGPFTFLSWIGVIWTSSSASWNRINEFLEVIETSSDLEKDIEETKFQDTDEILSVETKFWETVINLKIPRNKWTVFVSKTGVGKSSTLEKLAGILKKHNFEVSLVKQAPYLYNDTISNNLFLGKNPSGEEIATALELLKIFRLDNLGTSDEDLLNMEIGENGKKISGGQAKRLCLVRSLLSSPQFLIWDDPFSSIDLILEREIILELKRIPLMKNRGLILSSHRLSTTKVCDYVYYLDKELGIKDEGHIEHALSDKARPLYDFFEKQIIEN